jgi:hypothetical protein
MDETRVGNDICLKCYAAHPPTFDCTQTFTAMQPLICPTDPGEDKVEAVAARKDALAYTLDDWQALSRIVKTNIVETDGPDRVRWEGVWYEGPLATAYHRTLRAIEKMADRNIEILSPLNSAAITAMGHTPPSGEDGELRELLIESFDFLRGVDDAADLRKRVLTALQGIGGR